MPVATGSRGFLLAVTLFLGSRFNVRFQFGDFAAGSFRVLLVTSDHFIRLRTSALVGGDPRYPGL